MNTSEEIVRANPSLRRWVIVVLIACVSAGLIVLSYSPELLQDIEATSRNSMVDASDQLGSYIMTLSLVISLITVGLGVYLGGIAVRTLHERRFPPMGMQVIKDTRVVLDQAARRRAVMLIAIAIVLLVLTIIIPVVMWNIAMLFVDGIHPLADF